jgi:hypothetical protein
MLNLRRKILKRKIDRLPKISPSLPKVDFEIWISYLLKVNGMPDFILQIPPHTETKRMSLFDQILSAVSNPQQQASPDQLGNILGVAQQLSSAQGIDPSMTQTVLSMVGGYVRSSLQEKQSTMGNNQVQSLVNQFSGLGSDPQSVQAIFSPNQQQQVTQDVAQRTGLNAGTIQAMLPVLIPIVLNLLQSGANTQNAQAGNPVLNAFLDSNQDGNLDVGDVMGLAGKFFGQR